jgi:hypothetical protein
MKIRLLFVAIVFTVSALTSGCYSQGNSHFIASGENEYFFSMDSCEQEAKSTYSDGSPKYSGYECRQKLLWFTIQKRDFYEGKLSSESGL